eukprot:CAMPEP_0197194684 /NCGR_PEP_ID=MMETSP1423-20130617/29698_1 /TAXON_ID=476441 /ORGANISM="Pseudo-nitzschia heimii, Strain UNC1101" /LENGTH=47 /DNA_ID=CAMNT_0042648145 /DNA_START=76 /DNA_END=219 /DNA_ORIENTATION=+
MAGPSVNEREFLVGAGVREYVKGGNVKRSLELVVGSKDGGSVEFIDG